MSYLHQLPDTREELERILIIIENKIDRLELRKEKVHLKLALLDEELMADNFGNNYSKGG